MSSSATGTIKTRCRCLGFFVVLCIAKAGNTINVMQITNAARIPTGPCKTLGFLSHPSSPLSLHARCSHTCAKVDDVLEDIKSLTLIETAELVKKIQDAFGVSASVTMAVPQGAAAVSGKGAAEEAQEDEEDEEEAKAKVSKDSWEVVLTKVDSSRRMDMFRALKAMFPDMDLTTIKSHVDNLPFTVGVFTNEKAAQEAQTKIQNAGGTIEIQ